MGPRTVKTMEGVEETESADDSIVLSVREIWVAPGSWSSWSESAKSATRRAFVVAGLMAVIAGLLFVWLALGVFPEPDALAVAIYGSPLVVGSVGYVTQMLARRRLFTRTAHQMRAVMAPTLVVRPKWDDLLRLARQGGGVFAQESIVVRVEQRDAAIYLVATEYDVSKGEWSSAGSAGG